MRTIKGMKRSPQPELPEELTEWCPQATLDWWEMWRLSPLTVNFTEEEWAELIDTALVHAQFWSGKTTLAAELRRRTAKYGLTPEDRLRLRIQFAFADEQEEKAAAAKDQRQKKGARARRGPLKVVPD